MADTTSEVTGTLTKHADSGDTVIQLPHITQITDKDAVSLSEMPTMIYGAENRFVIDLGTKRTLELSCKRANPRSYNDSSSDRSRWSNAKWWSWFIDTIDEWQNTMTTDGNPEGGFELELNTGDSTLFPDVLGSNESKGLNVYISGSLSPSFGVDSLSFTLPMVVARLTTTGSSTRVATIEFYKSETDTKATKTISVPANVAYALESADADWAVSSAYLFSHWVAMEDGTVYQAGQTVILNEGDVLKLYPVWAKGQVEFKDVSGSGTIEVPAGYTRMVAYVVGGGGGAGGRSDSLGPIQIAGGAGGGGDCAVKTFWVSEGTEVSYTVGEGGRSGLNHNSLVSDTSRYVGSDGGESSISFTDSNGVAQKLTAAGGKGGAWGDGYATLTVDYPMVETDDGGYVFKSDIGLLELVDAGYDLYVWNPNAYSVPSDMDRYFRSLEFRYCPSGVGGARYEAGGSSSGYANATGENNGAGSASEPESMYGALTIRFDDGTTRDVITSLTATAGPSGGVPDVTLVDSNGDSVHPAGGIGMADGDSRNDDDMNGRYGGGGGASPRGEGPGLMLDIRTQGRGGDGAISLVFFEE